MRSILSIFVAGALALSISACESTGLDSSLLSIDTKAAMDVIPGDVKFVGMYDVADMSANPNFAIGGSVISLETLEGEAKAQVDDFLNSTGFDPAEDFKSIYVGAQGERDAMVVANANYDLNRVVEFIDSRSSMARKSSYRDMTTYEFDGQSNGAVGLAGESMIIAAASLADVQAALDRVIDGQKGVSSNPAIMDLIRKVSGGGAWFVASELPSGLSDSDNEMERAIASIGQIAVSVDGNADDVTSSTFLTPKDGLSPDVLGDLVKGAVAVLKLEAQDDAEAFDVLDNVRVRARQSDVQIDVTFRNEVFARLAK